jgi:hypothetical protein
MKLLQAIVTSSVETLDNRQGFGMVKCSRALPDLIKQQARDWGYSSDANGHPIFSLRHIDVFGVVWAVMNRTVPATDFTGRTSYVSHTITLRLDDLQHWRKKYQGSLFSSFEFMLHFTWQDAWNAKPSWIEEVDDIDFGENIAGHLFANHQPEVFDSRECIPSSPLLAFEFSEISKPKPKRLSWNMGTMHSAAVLSFFHQAWIMLDPWRGGRTYRDYLNEPNVSLAESWDYSFTTNLRNERPDPYQWVVLMGGSSQLGNRKNVDLNDWQNLNEQIVIQEIGETYGSLLVERSKNPKEWANGKIQKIMESHINEQREKYSHIIQEIELTVTEVFHEAEIKLSEFMEWRDGLQNQGLGSSALREIDEYILARKKAIDDLICNLNVNHGAVENELNEMIAPMQEILDSQTGKCFNDKSNLIQSPPDLSAKINDFNILATNVRSVYLYGSALERELRLIKENQNKAANLALLEGEREELKKLTERLRIKDRNSASEIAKLNTKAFTRRAQPAWQLPTLIGVSVIALALGAFPYIKQGTSHHENSQLKKQLADTQNELRDKEIFVRSNQDSIIQLQETISKKEAELNRIKSLNKNPTVGP